MSGEHDVEPYHGKAGKAQPVIEPFSMRDILPDELAQRDMRRTLQSMPYWGMVEATLPDPAKIYGLFMAATIDWLRDYRRVVQALSDDFARQAASHRALLDERAVVRTFFGVTDDRDALKQCSSCGLIDAHEVNCRYA